MRTSPALIAGTYAGAMPFVVGVLPALRAISPNTRGAAQLRCISADVWRFIDLPLISRGLLVGAIFAFTVTWAIRASVFVARRIRRRCLYSACLGSRGMNYGQALAMSTFDDGVRRRASERARKLGIGEFSVLSIRNHRALTINLCCAALISTLIRANCLPARSQRVRQNNAARIAAGLERADSGDVLLNGQSIMIRRCTRDFGDVWDSHYSRI